MSDIGIDPKHAALIYAAGRLGIARSEAAADMHIGVYRSVDGGKMWVAANRGLHTSAVTALAISADGRLLYAATDGEGVFRLEVKASPQTAAPKR